MALSPERRHTMRFYAEGARSRGERVTTSPKVLLELLDAAEKPDPPKYKFPVIRTAEALSSLPPDSIVCCYDKGGLLCVYHKIWFKTGEIEWHTPGVEHPVPDSKIDLPATLLFIPKRVLPLEDGHE